MLFCSFLTVDANFIDFMAGLPMERSSYSFRVNREIRYGFQRFTIVFRVRFTFVSPRRAGTASEHSSLGRAPFMTRPPPRSLFTLLREVSRFRTFGPTFFWWHEGDTREFFAPATHPQPLLSRLRHGVALYLRVRPRSGVLERAASDP